MKNLGRPVPAIGLLLNGIIIRKMVPVPGFITVDAKVPIIVSIVNSSAKMHAVTMLVGFYMF